MKMCALTIMWKEKWRPTQRMKTSFWQKSSCADGSCMQRDRRPSYRWRQWSRWPRWNWVVSWWERGLIRFIGNKGVGPRVTAASFYHHADISTLRWVSDELRLKIFSNRFTHILLIHKTSRHSSFTVPTNQTHPPLIKSTNVYSHSTLNNSSVTLTTDGNRANSEEQKSVNQKLCPTHGTRRTYRSWIYVFLLFPFLFWVQNLKQQISLDRLGWAEMCRESCLSSCRWTSREYCPQLNIQENMKGQLVLWFTSYTLNWLWPRDSSR